LSLYFCVVVTCWCYTGLSPATMTRLEMVSILCVMDRSHSQLIEAIPETCGVSHHDKDYESVIQQVGT